MTIEQTLRNALNRAWLLGQNYWRQADSDSFSQHRKSDETLATFQKLVDETVAQTQADSAPIDMVLYCPNCGMQHVDVPEHWDGKVEVHKSHLCVPAAGGCGHIWRPADVPTNGVQAVKTAGKADSPIAAPMAAAVPDDVIPLNVIRRWPDGFSERLQHVWLDVVSFIPDVKLYDLQRVLAEFGFELTVREVGAAAQAAKPKPECVKCLRCGHDNWIQDGKAPAQVEAPAQAAKPEPRQGRQDGDSTGAMAAAWFGTPGTEGAVSRVFGAQAAKPEQRQSDEDAAFLAARLRRLFKHFDVPVPDTDDNGLIGITGSLIGMLLTKLEAAPQQAPAQRLTDEQIPAVLFDGYAVLQSLTPQAKRRTNAENVADTLDAVVRLIRAQIKESK